MRREGEHDKTWRTNRDRKAISLECKWWECPFHYTGKVYKTEPDQALHQFNQCEATANIVNKQPEKPTPKRLPDLKRRRIFPSLQTRRKGSIKAGTSEDHHQCSEFRARASTATERLPRRLLPELRTTRNHGSILDIPAPQGSTRGRVKKTPNRLRRKFGYLETTPGQLRERQSLYQSRLKHRSRHQPFHRPRRHGRHQRQVRNQHQRIRRRTRPSGE